MSPTTSSKQMPLPNKLQRSSTATLTREDDTIQLTSDSLHDLTSPINQICSLSDLFLKKYQNSLDDEAKSLLGYMLSSATRLEKLMAGLRTYMQVAGPAPTCAEWDGNMLLAGALAMLQHTISQADAQITSESLPPLHCDAGQITYTLAGLIENAIKFHGEMPPVIHVSAIPDKKMCVLSVRDNGIGIKAGYTTRIFGAFKRIHNDTYPGSGVGLAIAKRIMERHGGRIWVESEPGNGSVFYLGLPKPATRRVKS